MSNISTVKTALDAEIQHAKQGLAFYTALITVLEQMIEQLDGLNTDAGAPPASNQAGKRAYSRRASLKKGDDAVPVTKPKKSAKAAKAARASSLPKTGGSFWQALLTSTPMSNQELLNAAIAALGMRPTPEHLKKLRQRLANAVTIMTKDGSMRSEGSGRARRFTSAAA